MENKFTFYCKQIPGGAKGSGSLSLILCFNLVILSSQVNMIDKILREFLWSDEKGNRKRHFVKWDWCFQQKKQGELGLKDIKTQGYALASKWM